MKKRKTHTVPLNLASINPDTLVKMKREQREEIAAATTMEDSPAALKKTTDKLLKEGLIMTDENHGPKLQVHKGKKMPKRSYYMISTAGIDKVMKYSNHIHSVTFNPK